MSDPKPRNMSLDPLINPDEAWRPPSRRAGVEVDIDPLPLAKTMSFAPAKVATEIFDETHDDMVDALSYATKALLAGTADAPPVKLDFDGKPLTYDDMKKAIDGLITPDERRKMEVERAEADLRKALRDLRPEETKLAKGFDLDKVGHAFAMTRTPGETDAEYRDRIKKMLTATHEFEKSMGVSDNEMRSMAKPATFGEVYVEPSDGTGRTMSDTQLQRALRLLRSPVEVPLVDVSGVTVMPMLPELIYDRAWDCAAKNVMRIFEALKIPHGEILVPETAVWPMICKTRGGGLEAIMFPRDVEHAELAMVIRRDDRPRDGELIFENEGRSCAVFHVENYINYVCTSGFKGWLDAMLNTRAGLAQILDDVGFLRVTHVEVPEHLVKLTTREVYPEIPKHVTIDGDVRIHIVFGSISTYLDFPVRGENDA